MDEENKKVQNPFGTGSSGQNAFRAAYNRLKSEADVARGNINRDYAGAYQQLRQQTYGQGLGAAAQAGLSGGQAGMMRNRVSASQMQALGGLMQGQESALRQQKAMEGSIYSNALLEGQQAQQYELQNVQNLASIQAQMAALQEGGLTEDERRIYNELQNVLRQNMSSANAPTEGVAGTTNNGNVNIYRTRNDAMKQASSLPRTEGYSYEVRYDEKEGGYVIYAVNTNNPDLAYKVAENESRRIGG